LKDISIQRKLAIFPVIAILMLLVLGCAIYYITKNTLENALINPMVSQAKNFSKQVNNIIRERQIDLKVWSNNMAIKSALEVEYGYEDISKLLSNLLKMKGYLIYIVVTDKQGKIVASTNNNLLNYFCNNTKWFKIVSKGKGYISDVKEIEKIPILTKVLSDMNNKFTIEIAFPIQYEDQFIGAIYAAFDWQEIEKIINIIKVHYINMNIKSGYACLVRKDGIIIAHSKPEFIGKHISEIGLKYKDIYIDEGFINFSSEDIKKIAGFVTNKSFGWKALVGADSKEIFRPVLRVNFVILIVTLVCTILILASSYVVAHNIKTPINELIKEIDKVAKGCRETNIRIKSKDECGKLAEAFNKMVKKINEYDKNLEKLVAERTKELENANRRLQKMDRLKTDFLSTVSHELRTPLTSVLGFAKIIKKKLEDVIFPRLQIKDKKTDKAIKQVKENLHIIVAEGERLTNLINDLLDLAKIESGKLQWKEENIDMLEVFERAVAAVSSLIQSKKLSLNKVIEGDNFIIKGDKDRLIQVVTNLLSNAIKFTDKGEITYRLSVKNDIIRCEIQDTGCGIPKDQLESIFEKFKQVGDTLTNRPRGTGLGLSICREIIKHHGGKIWAESEEGKGSKFIFTLPRLKNLIYPHHVVLKKEDLVPTIDNHIRERKSDVVVLIADDDPSIRKMLKQELQEWGYITIEATNAKDAIIKTKREKPDVVLLDIIMPHMSGYEALKVLKQDKETKDIPVIIVSIIEEIEKAFILGASEYITKPIDEKKLFESIEKVLKVSKGGVSNTAVVIVSK